MRTPRIYYNRRVGEGTPPKLTMQEATALIAGAFMSIDQKSFLQMSFGYFCVDAHGVAGLHGYSFHDHFFLKTGIRIEGQIADFIRSRELVELFTIVEFVFDYVAKPIGGGRYHSYANCGWHHDAQDDKFDVVAAQGEWRQSVNETLKFFEDGYELSPAGEVLRLAPEGMVDLVDKKPPVSSGDANVAKIANATKTFRRGLSTREEQKQAVRDLADVLEYYRPQVKENLLKEDESALFNIANNFALRHHRLGQRDDYNDVWLTWLFYWFLSTVHLVLALVHEQAATDSSDDEMPF